MRRVGRAAEPAPKYAVTWSFVARSGPLTSTRPASLTSGARSIGGVGTPPPLLAEVTNGLPHAPLVARYPPCRRQVHSADMPCRGAVSRLYAVDGAGVLNLRVRVRETRRSGLDARRSALEARAGHVRNSGAQRLGDLALQLYGTALPRWWPAEQRAGGVTGSPRRRLRRRGGG